MSASPRQASGGAGLAPWLLLAVLLILPGFALWRLTASVDPRLLAGIACVSSGVAFLAGRSDKRRAGAGERRISESRLHLLELVGGWPGSFLAQRIFRHKTAKVSYQGVFWLIVLAYQVVALDSLLGWRLGGELLRWFDARFA